MHVTVDGFGGDTALLANAVLVRDLLGCWPNEIGMTPVSAPYVFEYHGSRPEDWGISGFVILAESHIAIHTFPEHQQVWVDVFSCKGFDAAPEIERIVKTFDLQDTRVNVLERGLEYPHDVSTSIPLNDAERQELTDAYL